MFSIPVQVRQQRGALLAIDTTTFTKSSRTFVALAILLLGDFAGCTRKRVADYVHGDSPFLLVFVDAKTERALGTFPYDRAVLADAVRRSVAFGARGVVLKFFLDLPRSGEGDRALEAAMTKTRVVIEAGNSDVQTQGADLPSRFKLKLVPTGAPKALRTSVGGIPLLRFSANAFDVGFSDYSTVERAPMIEEYGGSYVKSMYTCSLELALQVSAHVSPGKSITFAGKTLQLDEFSQANVRFPTKDILEYVSFIDLLRAAVLPQARDRVVVIAFDGDRFASIQTPIGPIRPHRVFFYTLMSLYQDLLDSRPEEGR